MPVRVGTAPTIGHDPCPGSTHCAKPGSSAPCARPSAATAAHWRASGPTTSPRPRSRPPSSARASSRTSIEDVILGAANQAGEDNRNVARMAALLAGLPVEVAGQTVNRLCGSGLQAINTAAHAIMAGDGDAFVAGGVESMTRAPYVMAKPEARVRPRQPRDVRHDARLALHQPAAGRDAPPVLDGRDRRERRRAVRRHRARSRTRSLCAAIGAPSRPSRKAAS